MQNAQTETFATSADKIAAVIEDSHTPTDVRDGLIEALSWEICRLVPRLKFSRGEVIRTVYPILKSLEADGHVWREGEEPTM